jgi:hypothetical protein
MYRYTRYAGDVPGDKSARVLRAAGPMHVPAEFWLWIEPAVPGGRAYKQHRVVAALVDAERRPPGERSELMAPFAARARRATTSSALS